MTIYALRTKDTKEWVNYNWRHRVGDMRYNIDNTPKLLACDVLPSWHSETAESAEDDTGHLCEWVEVELTVKGEQNNSDQ